MQEKPEQMEAPLRMRLMQNEPKASSKGGFQ